MIDKALAADLARETFARGIRKSVDAAPADVSVSAPREKRPAGDVEDRPAPVVTLYRDPSDGLWLAEVSGLTRGHGTEADRIRDQRAEACEALALAVPDAEVMRWATSGSASILLWYRR